MVRCPGRQLWWAPTFLEAVWHTLVAPWPSGNYTCPLGGIHTVFNWTSFPVTMLGRTNRRTLRWFRNFVALLLMFWEHAIWPVGLETNCQLFIKLWKPGFPIVVCLKLLHHGQLCSLRQEEIKTMTVLAADVQRLAHKAFLGV